MDQDNTHEPGEERRVLGEASTEVLREFYEQAKARGPKAPQMLRKHNLQPRWGHPTTPPRETTSDD